MNPKKKRKSATGRPVAAGAPSGDLAAAPYHHGALRAALLRAARALLEERGYESLTLRAAARRAGVSQAAPYHHFEDKAALLHAVAAEGFRDFAIAMEARMSAFGEPRARLNAAGLAYVEFAVANPAVFRLMFSGARSAVAGESELGRASAAAHRVLEKAASAVASNERAGRLQGLKSWALVHGLATLVNEGMIDPADHGASSAAELVGFVVERTR